MIICVLIVLIVLMCIAFSLLSKSYPKDEQDIYEARLAAVKQIKRDCSKLIDLNETNINWWKAMHAAFRLDEINATNQLELANESANNKDFLRANNHLQKAINWYEAYNTRLKRIYGKEPGEAPTVPVIK